MSTLVMSLLIHVIIKNSCNLTKFDFSKPNSCHLVTGGKGNIVALRHKFS